MRHIFLLGLIVLLMIPAAAQNRRLIQFTGRVFDDFIQPLPYAHILVLNSNRGTITDRKGKFSFVVEEGDSVMFSTLGFHRIVITIPDTLEKPFFTRDILLERDTFLIAEVEVYPWKDYEEFKEAFLNLELPEDDMDRARKNIALIKTQIILDDNPSARENYQHILEQQYRETYTRGTYPTYQIFNVFAWSEFIKAIKRGDFKKKE